MPSQAWADDMSFELVSLDNPGVVLSITSGSKLTLGRQARFKVETMAVSREHCTLICSREKSGHSIRVHARKTCYISGASHKKACKVPSKQSKEVRHCVSHLSAVHGRKSAPSLTIGVIVPFMWPDGHTHPAWQKMLSLAVPPITDCLPSCSFLRVM